MALDLLRFVYRETAGVRLRVIATSLVAGLGRGAMLSIINSAAGANADKGHFQPLLLLAFFGVLGLYLGSTYKSALYGRGLVDAIGQRLRLRLIERLLCGPLRFVESTGMTKISTAISQDIGILSGMALTFAKGFESTMLLVFALGYLGWLSPLGLTIALVAIGAGAITYLWQIKRVTQHVEQLHAKSREFYQCVDDVLRGFKEVKQHRARHADLVAHLITAAHEYRALSLRSERKFVVSTLSAEIYMFLMVAALVFALPMIAHIDRTVLFQFLASILFIVGPLEALISSVPSIAVAQLSLGNLRRFERSVEDAIGTSGAPGPVAGTEFRRLALSNVHFRFVGESEEECFDVGPIELELRRGEVLFIVGGNGAGKTTMLKLLAGLYMPDTGCVLLDGQPVGPANYQAYRELFAVVFADFHMFQRLYGLDLTDPGPVERLLARLQLGHKTRLADRAFHNSARLSTGQRKRLGYAFARLADRQVYVFDEFAADQDPGFRNFFYHELVPELQRQGKTVVAVTHDDRYLDVADRVVKMEYGQLVDWRTKPAVELAG